MHVSFSNYGARQYDDATEPEPLIIPVEVIQALWRMNWLDDHGKPVREHPNGKYLRKILQRSKCSLPK